MLMLLFRTRTEDRLVVERRRIPRGANWPRNVIHERNRFYPYDEPVIGQRRGDEHASSVTVDTYSDGMYPGKVPATL